MAEKTCWEAHLNLQNVSKLQSEHAEALAKQCRLRSQTKETVLSPKLTYCRLKRGFPGFPKDLTVVLHIPGSFCKVGEAGESRDVWGLEL